jgi:hypothetical protein
MSQDPMHLDIGDPKFEQRYNRILRGYLVDPQQMNSYGYARNNPLSNKDPNGEGYEILADLVRYLGNADSLLNGSGAYYDFGAATANPNSSLTRKIAAGATLTGDVALFIPEPHFVALGVTLSLWEGFKRGGRTHYWSRLGGRVEETGARAKRG